MFDITKVAKKKSLYLIVLISIIVISAFVGLYETDVFNRDYSVTYSLAGDGYGKLVLVKAMREQGISAMFNIDRLGAPDTSAQILMAYNDPLVLWSLFLISLVSSSAPATLFVYYVLTFILASAGMYWLLCKMNIHPIIAGALSLLFSFSPYHFYRGLGHTILISIFTIPLGIAIAYYMLENSGVLRVKRNNTNTHLFSAKEVLICSIISGLGCSYYVFFLMMMYAVAFFCGLLTNLSLFRKGKALVKHFAVQLWAPALMALIAVLGQVPRLLYCHFNNVSGNALERSKYGSEVMSLKLGVFFMPAKYHNISALKKLSNEFANGSLVPSEGATLGLIAGIGIVLLLITIFCNFPKTTEHSPMYRFLALMVVVYFMVATSGGIGLIFNVFVTPQFRCYNRVSIVICCIGYIAVAIFLQDIFKSKKSTSIVLTAVMLAVGIYDQVPFSPYIKYSPEAAKNSEMYEEFFSQIENSLEPGSMVYQLPFAKYPEQGPINRMADYSHFSGYYFTDTIRWSYGAVKDVDTTAEELYLDNGMSFRFLDAIYNAGFRGVYIDTNAYDDGGERILAFYDSLDLNSIVSANGKMYFYSLADVEDLRRLYISRILDCGDGNVDEELVTTILSVICDSAFSGHLIYEVWENSSIVELDAEEYVKLVYDRILNRSASASDIATWVNAINNGTSYSEVLLMFLDCSEFANSWIVATSN